MSTEVNVQFLHVPVVPKAWTFLDIGGGKPFANVYRSAALLSKAGQFQNAAQPSKTYLAITGMTLDNLLRWKPKLYRRLKRQLLVSQTVLLATEYYHSSFSFFDTALFEHNLHLQIKSLKRFWGKCPQVYFHPFTKLNLTAGHFRALHRLDFDKVILPRHASSSAQIPNSGSSIINNYANNKEIKVKELMDEKKGLEHQKEAMMEGFNHLQKDFFLQFGRVLQKESFPQNAAFLQDFTFLRAMGSDADSQAAYDLYINCMNMVKHVELGERPTEIF